MTQRNPPPPPTCGSTRTPPAGRGPKEREPVNAARTRGAAGAAHSARNVADVAAPLRAAPPPLVSGSHWITAVIVCSASARCSQRVSGKSSFETPIGRAQRSSLMKKGCRHGMDCPLRWRCVQHGRHHFHAPCQWVPRGVLATAPCIQEPVWLPHPGGRPRPSRQCVTFAGPLASLAPDPPESPAAPAARCRSHAAPALGDGRAACWLHCVAVRAAAGPPARGEGAPAGPRHGRPAYRGCRGCRVAAAGRSRPPSPAANSRCGWKSSRYESTPALGSGAAGVGPPLGISRPATGTAITSYTLRQQVLAPPGGCDWRRTRGRGGRLSNTPAWLGPSPQRRGVHPWVHGHGRRQLLLGMPSRARGGCGSPMGGGGP